jgi:hypothetical protein
MVYISNDGERVLSSSKIVQTQVQKPQRSHCPQALAIPAPSVGSQPIFLAAP